MPDDLASLVQVTFVYDATLGSVIEQQPLGGTKVGVPASCIPLPQRGTLLGQSGFSRQPAGAWEWVMTGGGTSDPFDAFLDSLPAGGVWKVPASRATVKSLVLALQNKGFTRNQIQTQVPQLYSAIATEALAP